MNERDERPAGLPGAAQPVDAARLLQGIDDDLQLLDGLSTQQQPPVYDRLNTALADALARTADTGVPPGNAGA
jgi:hypothetical protein